jgi:hypothetical protein
MHTQKNHLWPRVCVSEQRLLRLSGTESRIQSHESGEGSKGSQQATLNEVEKMKQEDDDFVERVSRLSGAWVLPGYRTKKAIIEESRKKMEKDHPELAARWSLIFRPALRATRHMVEKRIARDLAKQLIDLERGRAADANAMDEKFSRLESGLKSGSIRVRKRATKVSSARQKKLGAVEQSFAKESAKAESGSVPEQAKKAMEAELILRKDLVKRGVIRADEINVLFEENSRAGSLGTTRLQRLIAADPALSKDPSLQKRYLEYVRLLRSGHLLGNKQKWYRSFFLTEGKLALTVQNRLRFLKETPVIEGQQIKVQLPNLPAKTLYAKGRSSDHDRIELMESGSKERFSIFPVNPQTGEGYIVYRGSDGKLHETKLTDTNFRITL